MRVRAGKRFQNALDDTAGKIPPDPTRHSRGAAGLEALGAEAVREVRSLGHRGAVPGRRVIENKPSNRHQTSPHTLPGTPSG